MLIQPYAFLLMSRRNDFRSSSAARQSKLVTLLSLYQNRHTHTECYHVNLSSRRKPFCHAPSPYSLVSTHFYRRTCQRFQLTLKGSQRLHFDGQILKFFVSLRHNYGIKHMLNQGDFLLDSIGYHSNSKIRQSIMDCSSK